MKTKSAGQIFVFLGSFAFLREAADQTRVNMRQTGLSGALSHPFLACNNAVFIGGITGLGNICFILEQSSDPCHQTIGRQQK